MTHKYERQCWSCNSRDLERFPDYVKCLKCGATWSELPKLSPPILDDHKTLIRNEAGEVISRAYKLTDSVKRRAVRAQLARSKSASPK